MNRTPSTRRRQLLGARARAFVLLRFTLIIATAYLLLVQHRLSELPSAISWTILGGLLSNLLVIALPERWLTASAFTGAVMVADTVWITAALLYTGTFGADFFYLYFFVLFLAAIGENLRLIALGAVVVSAAYAWAITATGGLSTLLSSSSLIRIPFLFAVAIFYGYQVERLRQEQRRFRQEARMAEENEEARRTLIRANTQLARANEELTHLSEMKSDFVSMVSHELRTPVTSVRNALDLLAGGADAVPETRERFIAMARRNLQRLTRIVDDILDLSKIEAGRLEFRFQRVSVGRFLKEVHATFEPEARAASLRLELDMPSGLPDLWADPQRLEQVVGNLLSNALKFTPPGGAIRLRARPVGEGVELAVSDDGVGMSPAVRARVFERFFQGEDPLTRTQRGTGLGLSIAADLVQALGGELEVESDLGGGSRFHFHLPALSPSTEELALFESEVRRFRSFPFFSLLQLVPRDSEGADLGSLKELATRLEELLPRASDHVLLQPRHGRLLVVLLGTAREGAGVVAQRLRGRLQRGAAGEVGGGGSRIVVSGPVTYPEDGVSGRELLQSIENHHIREEDSHAA